MIIFCQLWRRAVPGRKLQPTEYLFPDDPEDLSAFIKKHDSVADQLDILAARDELLSGNEWLNRFGRHFTDVLCVH